MQTFIPKQLIFSLEEKNKKKIELDRFLDCGVIEKATTDTDNECISNIFIRPKKCVRIILNLKYYNSQYTFQTHFKIESLRTAISAMRENGFIE